MQTPESIAAQLLCKPEHLNKTVDPQEWEDEKVSRGIK